MRRIETPDELRAAWTDVVWRLRRDLSASRRLRNDPQGTLRALGYQLGPDAERLLEEAL
ncbi:MAG: hypothetical protein ACQEXJ_21960 [Myxococcota bacterium]